MHICSTKSTIILLGLIILSLSNVAKATHWVINNTCSFDVTVWHVGDNPSGPSVVGARKYYYDVLANKADNSGPSVKVSITGTQEVVAQLEYTVGAELLYYDLSHINGHPFLPHGIELRSSIGSCTKVDCAPGEPVCAGAYHTPYDNWATTSCDPRGYLTLDLCV